MKVTYLGGQHVQVGNEKFGSESRKDFAKWRAAIEELESAGFISDPRGRGEYFDVTQ